MFFAFNVEAHNDGNGYSGTEFIAAYSYEQAVAYIKNRLATAGWTVDKLEACRISITDIRDICDEVTW